MLTCWLIGWINAEANHWLTDYDFWENEDFRQSYINGVYDWIEVNDE